MMGDAITWDEASNLTQRCIRSSVAAIRDAINQGVEPKQAGEIAKDADVARCYGNMQASLEAIRRDPSQGRGRLMKSLLGFHKAVARRTRGLLPRCARCGRPGELGESLLCASCWREKVA